MAINIRRCPKCGGKGIRILYGYLSHEAFEEAEAGKIVLGGCVLYENSPEYQCSSCEYQWIRDEVIDKAYEEVMGIEASLMVIT